MYGVGSKGPPIVKEPKGPQGIRAGDQGISARAHTYTRIAASRRPLGEFSGTAW